ncbi:MAG: polysaccharide pyruvyl transferase family protein [Gemmatimonadales bacterium]
MYTILSGAKINMGDFLITQRARELLTHLRPEHTLFQLPHWEPLEPHLEQVNASRAVIILGGPGYQPQFYPGVYKLTQDLQRLRVPIIPLGVGWKGFPGDWDTVRHYRFTPESLAVLRRISAETPYLGCRDHLSREVLRRNGISNALVTGCPAWYHLPSLGLPLHLPDSITSFAVTPAQRPMYQAQSIAVLRALAERFPAARRYCSFNRGIDQDDPRIPGEDRRNNRIIAAAALQFGYEVMDVSGGLDRIGFYDTCDFHAGYRVHSHIYFLSRRRPSFLLHEDGRGRGMSAALSVPGIDAFQRAGRFWNRGIRPGRDTVEMLAAYVDEEVTNGFARFAGMPDVLDAHYAIMRRFIAGLPA